MEKETRITVPEGYEVEKIEPIEGAIIVTYKAKERKLPKSWEEFCEMFPDYSGEYFIEPNNDEKIDRIEVMWEGEHRKNKNAELLPDRATAEAILALCQLIQLRNCYNGDFVPDWFDVSEKYTIEFEKDKIITNFCRTFPQILYFKTAELRDEFLRNFRPLIEKLKPLYGIKIESN